MSLYLSNLRCWISYLPGAQSSRERCLPVEFPVFLGGCLLLAGVQGCGSRKAVSGGSAEVEGAGKTP